MKTSLPLDQHALKTCTDCVLPETFPGVSFNAAGQCNHCQKSNGGAASLAGEKRECRRKFHDLLYQQVTKSRRQAGPGTRRPYDVLLAYSGGKDSTYTLLLLKRKYRLRVLAVTLDNGFLSDTTRRNIQTACDRLGIDHLYFKPKWTVMKRIFTVAAEQELYAKKTLERASTICTTCMGIVKSVCLKLAIETDTPLVGYGWSPGQAPLASALMKNNPALVRTTQQAMLKPLRELAGREIEAYFLNEKHYTDPEAFPHNIHPMAWEPYDERAILEEIATVGWVPPPDTDSNSTNCLLNALANDLHLKRYGFHPYAWEIANMVRTGVMTRDEGRRKLLAEQPSDAVERARERLFAAEAPDVP